MLEVGKGKVTRCDKHLSLSLPVAILILLPCIELSSWLGQKCLQASIKVRKKKGYDICHACDKQKPISKETAGSQQPGSPLKLVQVLLSVLEEHVGGSYCGRALICWMGDGSLAGVWLFIPGSGFMVQTSSEFQLVTIAVHDCRGVLGQMAAGRRKKGFGRCINLSLMLVLPWEDVVLHLICFYKFLHICLFSKTNQRS